MRRYGVIVVGGGGSGAPLAARLSADPERSVLLLEAGPAPASAAAYPPELLDAGTVQGAMPGYAHNWSFAGHLTPQLPYSIARGRFLGGSTAVNGGYFVRAAGADFEDWALAGGPDWSAAAMQEFYAAAESGPMRVEPPPQEHRVTRAFAQAAADLGFAPEPDKNAGGLPGVGPVPMNVHSGTRWNTALAFLEPVRGRSNLTIQGDTVVRRVLFDGTRAVGVEVEQGGERSELLAGEVVLCAGAINSAHLLLLSGVGPRDALEAHGIAVVADRPGVGGDFSDHPEVSVRWVPRPGVVDNALPRIMESCLNFASDPAAGSASGDLEILPMLKPMGYLLSGNSSARVLGVREGLRNPVALLRSLRGIPLRRLLADWRHQEELEFLVALQRPTSRGQLTLESADPAVQPRLDYHHLSTPEDRERLRTGVRTAVSLLASRPFRPLVHRIGEPCPAVLADDRLLDEWMLSRLGTALHLSGTAKLGRAEDPGAVVDAVGRVHGVSGLRVADTSILPAVPQRGPAATAVLIGEFVGERMRAAGRVREGGVPSD